MLTITTYFCLFRCTTYWLHNTLNTTNRLYIYRGLTVVDFLLLSKPLFDEADKFFLALVSQLHIFHQLSKLQGPIVSQHESIPSLEQKIDKFGVVTWRDAAQSRMSRRDVCGNRSVEQLSQRRDVTRQH